ncbi:hypothetical protein Bb109J_c1436 [Bdellovibrio bacteriovorus]|uniref:hypothetical protein n=1 Tax=Bdellovibrio bacteriovorus TaxID=959 RepID=UPI00045C0A52|nr:hypothetical protein [Bdellovibrio bacteriovorus]AHZ84133.1 hypothetical protein EP01_04140 [Bdellovibrio bacteriovorus]BEV68016.1 hypothetical protein Bb109J_c1436 [Bdellovibrio bacteriovorus]
MSSFDDLKEKLVSDARVTWERIQESGAYNQLRDRYENMTPAMQKLTLVGGVALVSLIILSIPYGKYTQSTEYVGEFESKRMTIRELLKVSRESSDVPQIPQAPSMDMIRNNIDNQIKAANLLPEQIKGTEVQENNSNLVPKNLTEGLLQVSLAKLNIRQVLDLGYQFQSINPSVKMKDMVMTANREDNRYFDVVYKLVALAVPAAPAPEAPEPPSRSNRFKRNNNNDSGDE